MSASQASAFRDSTSRTEGHADEESITTPARSANPLPQSLGRVNRLEAHTHDLTNPSMGAEDFSYMLEERPGAMVLLGTGPGAYCHNPAFDYNDDASPIGASWFARLVETALPLAR